MVVVITVHTPNMQRDIRSMRKAMQPMRDHLGAEVADLLAAEAQVDHRPGATGEVDDGPREGFVERGVAAAEAGDGGAGAEGVGECCAEGKEGVFCRVVVVNCIC